MVVAILHKFLMYREGGGCGEGEKSHSAIMEHELGSVEQLVGQRTDIRRLRDEEANALMEENYEEAEILNKKLEEMTVLSEWDIAGKGLGTVSERGPGGRGEGGYLCVVHLTLPLIAEGLDESVRRGVGERERA